MPLLSYSRDFERILKQLFVGKEIFGIGSVGRIDKIRFPRTREAGRVFPQGCQSRSNHIGSKPGLFSCNLQSGSQGGRFQDADQKVDRPTTGEGFVLRGKQAQASVSNIYAY